MKSIYRILIVMFSIMAVALFAAAYKENDIFRMEKKKNRQLKEFVVENNDKKTTVENKNRIIDFHTLKNINEDIYAWIFIPGTNIDYPVLIGDTDTEYLKKDFRGEYSELGAVFAFADTDKTFLEEHICLFAHNMKSPQMFGELKKYKNSDFAKKHSELYLYLPNRIETYRLISVFECDKRDQIFTHKFQNSWNEFERIRSEIVLNSRVNISQSMTEKRRNHETILTLSTCSEYDRTNKRMTIHFEKCVEK